MSASTYLLDNAASEAAARFAALSALYDPVTARHVEALGLPPGGACWEVGAGGPSVPAMLARLVGPRGRVLATDLDVGWIDDVPPGVEVRVHDVAADDPPGKEFDLVHARLVLTHVPERDEALRRMIGALRPGGWVLVEDYDVESQPVPCLEAEERGDVDGQRANRLRAGFIDLLARRGVHLRYGRALPRVMGEAGLVDVGADATFPLADPAVARLEAANVHQVGAGLVATGWATEDDLAAHLDALGSGRLHMSNPPLVSAWGRKP
ncbi:methyltransferase [Actinomycetospora sp. NBRC 106375]|uniref:class I SAM-dependent methyltransferase n=1 Tax=Actinomycetospora sp. NBRC 106375 TaxID=3032207 RepID=UPI0024A0711C|nr:methyltransferase domain-containing protein [Actinomycetospora sp. NBRC 106375]GLZ45567.1 methyltransferase [Actinomycetospora sp. NBRC 106375]